MRAVWWMIGSSLVSGLVARALVGSRGSIEILFGLIGPLAAASGSWVLAERTFRRSPERLTSLMIAAFAVKLVFFGVYVTAVLAVPSMRPVPFVISFTSYFIGLYVIEALCLRRLFAGGWSRSK